MIKARKLLVKLLGIDVTETLYFEASITRIDLSVNLLGLIEQYFIHKTKTNYSSIQRSLYGEIESQIAGGNESRVRATFYNKNLEQLEQGEEVANLDEDYHRLEIRLRDLQLTMSQLDFSILEVFNTVSFHRAGFLRDDWFSTDFLENVELEGLNSALHSLGNSNDRRSYLCRLNHYKFEVFSTDNLNFSKPHQMLSFLIQKRNRVELLANVS